MTGVRMPGNLPVQVTSFVGRDDVRESVREALTRSKLVTLTGFGGMGKSRLALTVAEEVRDTFADGVWFVDLTPVKQSSAIEEAVLAALGGQDHSTGSAHDQLLSYLEDRQILLLLDNCEHVIDQAAALAAELLATDLDVHILATSRESLRAAGEQVIPVPPLSAPDPSSVSDSAQVTQYDSAALLLDRATAAHPGFAITDANFRAVAQLCARLEGSPLAIELAATRLRSLSVAQVVQRLDDQFHVLGSGERSAPPRQRSLRALVDWSYDLCSVEERLLWQRASVFAGGFDLEAAEGVCADENVTAREVLQLIDQLVSKSILMADTDASTARFRFLETIRQYGYERLGESGQAESVSRAHRDYYLALARTVFDNWATAQQIEGISQLRDERFNISRALEWSFSTPGEQQAGLEMVITLRFHWAIGGFLREGRRWLDQAITYQPEPTPARGTALWVAAWVALVQGDRDGAATYLVEAQRTADALGGGDLQTYVELMIGTAALFRSDLSEAITALDRAIIGLEAIGDHAGILLGSMQLVVALAQAGESSRAQQVAASALQLSEDCGEHWGRCQAMWALGFDSWLSADHDRATSLVRQALAMKPEFNRVGTALDIDLLAWVAASQGDNERAVRLFGAARSMWTDLGTTIGAFGLHFAEHSALCEKRLRVALAPDKFDALAAEGASWSAPRAVTYALGGRERTLDTSTTTLPVALTRRERQVADMVADGLSNREIAEELVLSTRTVDGHVENIFSKLHVNSRAQVAAWVTRTRAAAENG
ncbi:ATP-binding protein [Rhodococcus opacus]|uniref:ATP-binding protein n=1 Tax=Rhodococcus opacus TaxID=37919 RepID=UPI001603EA34|nr:LuxR C-terminal-related transcriptional regulator [Rhodococcus opacus]QZS52508.1 LuxR C-terminal-related transcriptional regulator [Rhodococcus opacus]